MALWRFMAYCMEGSGENLIATWYEAQDPAVQAAFDATLLTLGDTPDWSDEEVKEFKVLTQEHVGLGEIRFNIEWKEEGRRPYKRRFRPLGIWPPTGKDFIILLGCEKSGRTEIPWSGPQF